MRRGVAALLACLFMAIGATDRVVCPDGCTDDGPVRTQTSDACGPCASCQGWSPSPAPALTRPVLLAAGNAPPRPMRLLTRALPPPDHPPEAA